MLLAAARAHSGLAADVAAADPLFIGILSGVLAFVALSAGLLAWHNFHRARLIEDTPTAKARSAPQGYVELEGLARRHDDVPLIAPLSGLPCAWYRYRVEEEELIDGKGSDTRRWVLIDRGESRDTFFLEDDTGSVVVDPEGAHLTTKHRDQWESRSRLSGINKPSDWVTRFVASHPAGNRYRFTEERINPGDYLYTIGLLRNLGAIIGHTTVDDEARTIIREWKQDQAALRTRFDLDQDGSIDQKEWMLARAQARREAVAARIERAKQHTEGLNLLGRTNDRRRPFLISAHPPEEFTRRLRLWGAGALAGSFAAVAAALWLLNARFG